MLDGISLDQLRAFVTAVDEGSFSAAARKLRRVQSAVSGWIGGLEAQLGVALFDRSGRIPVLTPEGTLLAAEARSIVAAVDLMKGRARLMASGLEPELSVVVDVFLPTAAVTEAAKAFARQFPMTPLRVFVEGLGAGYQPVIDGRCALGILAVLPVTFPDLTSHPVGEITLVMVAGASHPLAQYGRKRVPRQELARHVQLVLTDRSTLLGNRDYGVLSPSTWRLADLATKHAFLLDGVGYGSMPLHMVQDDVAAGRLVLLEIEGMTRKGVPLVVAAVHPAAVPPGPAGRWFIEHMGARCGGAARAADR